MRQVLFAGDLGLRRNCRSIRGSWQSGPSPSLSSARAAWACGSSAAHTGQVSGGPVSPGIASSIRAAAACCHCLASSARHLIRGDGLDQPVHRHRPAVGRGDQRIPAQRPDRVTGRQRVFQQRQPALAPPRRRAARRAQGGVAAAGAAGSPRARRTPAAAAGRPRPARCAAGGRTPAPRWWPPSCRIPWARRGPAVSARRCRNNAR